MFYTLNLMKQKQKHGITSHAETKEKGHLLLSKAVKQRLLLHAVFPLTWLSVSTYNLKPLGVFGVCQLNALLLCCSAVLILSLRATWNKILQFRKSNNWGGGDAEEDINH